MSDLISRSEVWKAFISRVDSICDLGDVREILDSIPTAEPTIDDIAERISNTDWYHIFKGELRHGAHDREEALFKAEDIFNVLKDIGASEEYTDQEWLDWREEQEYEDRWNTMGRSDE